LWLEPLIRIMIRKGVLAAPTGTPGERQ
jgi:hypothetical protein